MSEPIINDPFENSKADYVSVSPDAVRFSVNTSSGNMIKVQRETLCDTVRYKLVIEESRLLDYDSEWSVAINVSKEDLKKIMAIIREAIEYEEA